MISIAADLDHVYRLANGTISAYLQADPERVIRTVGQPPSPAVQLAASRTYLFARTESGDIYGRPAEAFGRWSRIDTPPGTAWISTDDSYVYALAGGVRQRLLVGGGSFGSPDAPIDATLVQIDHDELLIYALSEDGRILIRHRDGAWREMMPLGNVVEIVGGLDMAYARTDDGDVWRSHVFGRSGWARLGIAGAEAIAIDADHTDTLYVGTESGFRTFPGYSWKGDGVVRSYVARDYALEWATVSDEGTI